MAVTIGAAWMGGVWRTVNSERALKKELEEALGKAHAATERAADLRRQIEGSRYLREGVAETASGGRAIKPRKTGPY
jgi:hypothetical protein